MASIVRLLSLVIACMGVSALFPAAISARLGEGIVPVFFATSLGCIFLAGAMRFASAGLGGPMRRFQVLGALAALWIIVPLLAAPAVAVTSGLNLWEAWFEALSAFTTTGFTAVTRAPRSFYVWVAMLQWSGGLLTIVTAVAVLAPAGIGGLPNRTGRQNEAADAVDPAGVLKDLAPIYLGATAIAFIAMLVDGHSLYLSFCLASAVTAAGAHLPPEGVAAIQGGGTLHWVLLPFLLWTATSVRWHRALVGRRIHAAPEQAESLMLLGYWVVLGVTFAVILFRLPSVMTVQDALGEGFFAAASLISTSGIPPAPGTYAELPQGLVLIVALVGGGAFSLAGGLKLMRVRALLGRVRGDLMRLLYPHLVQPARIGEDGARSAMRGIWVAMVAMFATLAGVLIVMSIGTPSFEAALTGAVAALTNTGPLYDASGAGWPPIASLNPLSLLGAAFAMIAGRLETVGAFVLIHLAVWRT